MLKKVVLAGVLAAAVAWPAAGRPDSEKPKKQMQEGNSTSMTATVEAIDTAKRELTLKSPKGEVVVMAVPDVVKRFNEIKVGDTLRIKYSEAVIVKVHKEDSSAKLGVSGGTDIERHDTAKPSGVITRQITAVVEVTAVDTKTPSITVKEADGNTVSMRVEDKKNLEGVKPGDKLSVTYKEAVAMSISSPPAK